MKSTLVDPREDFLNRLDLGDTRIKSFRGFFFLCGGPHDAASHDPFRSVRHLIYHELISGKNTDLVDRLKLAEDIQDWFRDGKYSDLVTFEEHLASLSSVILLIVESPGSIAELGAFAVTRSISGRLITMIDEQHYSDDSFIRLGPIRRLESETGRKVVVHDWHDVDLVGRRTPNYEKIRPDVADILNEVRALLSAQTGEQVFRVGEPGHAMILICEICDLFGALSQAEIEKYVQSLDHTLDKVQVEQFLFLLVRCDILRVKPKGHGRYYHAPNWSTHVTFSFQDAQRVDRDRVRVDVFEFYKQTLRSRADVVRVLRKAS